MGVNACSEVGSGVDETSDGVSLVSTFEGAGYFLAAVAKRLLTSFQLTTFHQATR